jgi:hypothetical protein
LPEHFTLQNPAGQANLAKAPDKILPALAAYDKFISQ